MTKTCTKCGVEKAETEYSGNGKRADGTPKYRTDCKACVREYNAKRHAENKDNPEYRERARERAAKWYAENRERARKWYAENRERKREYKAKWNAKNREWVREYAAKWRENNPDYAAKYHAENPEVARAGTARYAARKRGLPDDGSGVADWLDRMEDEDIFHCHLCGAAFTGTEQIDWDHRDPVSTGTAGTVLANMAAAHSPCNRSRRNTPLDEWAERVGLPDGIV